jgi:CRP/FNR family transcriptional regulator, cyclic AMP receptor protein
MTTSIEQLLAEQPYFKGLSAPQLAAVTGCAKNVRFEAGEHLVRQGEDANEFFVIRQGKVALEASAPAGPITVQTLGDGDVVGWSWLVQPHVWRLGAVARELTRAISLDGACLRRKCEEDHDLGFELLKRFSFLISERLEATRLQLLDFYSPDHAGGRRR